MDQKIIDNVKQIAYSILGDERINSDLNFDMRQAEKMDSVNRVAILAAIEDEYDFIFKLKEISSWNTVMELVAIIASKM